MTFIETINSRRSIRKFKDQIVDEKTVHQLLEIINKAPTAGNIQSYKIFVLCNKAIQQKLVDLKPNQKFLLEASHILVFCADLLNAQNRYGERGKSLYSLQDATIACTFGHLATTDLGLGSVWVGAFNEEKVSELLNLPPHLRPIAMLPIGYPNENPEERSRKRIEDVVIFLL